MLLEPLPSLLSCVRRLAASCRQQQQAEEEQAAAGMGMGVGDDGEGDEDGEAAGRRLPGLLLDGEGEGGGGDGGQEVVELDLEAMEDEQAPAKVGGRRGSACVRVGRSRVLATGGPRGLALAQARPGPRGFLCRAAQGLADLRYSLLRLHPPQMLLWAISCIKYISSGCGPLARPVVTCL